VRCGEPWDAENRLIAAAPTFAQSGDARVSFAYDYLGRRVLKVVEEYDGSTWTETARRKFIWSGWLMLMELDCGTGVPPVNDAVVRKYTWGLDLAGLNGQINSLESAGGIGGLVGIYDADATPGPAGGDGNYAVLCDANGNVTQLVAWASTVQDDSETALGSAWDANRIAAHYEYGPYGNVLNDLTADDDLDGVPDAGAYAAENPWRFSTKQFDAETGLGYWGYRYYSPALGRWMSRDPIGEAGGPNLYGYVGNEPISAVDLAGLVDLEVSPVTGLDATGTARFTVKACVCDRLSIKELPHGTWRIWDVGRPTQFSFGVTFQQLIRGGPLCEIVADRDPSRTDARHV
jgi:RHS repeat-associated protein